MSPDTPDLRFGPGSNSGFTPAGIAAFDDLRPAAVVRELIQNALDAARQANVSPAVVRFCLSKHTRNAIPGLKSYKRAFERAVESQQSMMGGKLASQAELVRKRIAAALSKSSVDFLAVFDNGIGLDEKRMNALLSDGLSVKGNNGATGTYGNGHATAIPASDLRYVLYGGITADGQRISAGHAVLASHYVDGDEHRQGGDGFYVRGFKPGAVTLFDYPANDQVPELINNNIDRIESGCGTVVIIPAFNHFLEKKQTLWELVSYAASANFFVAIEEGELEIEMEDSRQIGITRSARLDRAALSEVLKTHREKKRSSGLISGLKAFEAHRTFQRGRRQVFRTSKGAIEIHLVDNPAGITRVDLCRNGMWITNELPGFYGKFADRVPFHAVLSLKAENGGCLHKFVRQAEGPLHDKLAAKRLDQPQRREFQEAMREIVEQLRQQTSILKSDAFVSEEFLTLDFGIDGPGGGSGAISIQGAPTVIDRRPAQQLHAHQAALDWDTDVSGQSDGASDASSSSSIKSLKRRPQLSALFQAVSLPIAERRRRIHIRFFGECLDAQLRLLVDEGLDATCDRHGLDKYSPAELRDVTINGTPAAEDELDYWDSQVVGVRFGDVAEGLSVIVETDFLLGDDFNGLQEPSLRIEVFTTPKVQPTSPNNPTSKLGDAANA